MPRFFSNKRLILLLVGVIVLVALISFTLKERHNASLPEQVVKDVVGFGQSIFSKPTQFVTNIIINIEDIMNTYEENKVLKKRLNEYASTQAELSDRTAENDRLRDIIGKEEDLRAYEPIHATVIARNPDQWEQKIIIDKGEVHGIQKNMAVITATGLIGKVILVTSFNATVELLTTENHELRVSVFIPGESPVFGLIEGYDRTRGELIMKIIDDTFEIEKGQKVSTSGLGGIFPKGLFVGEVSEISTDDYGLTKIAYIRPAADFSWIDHIMIAKRSVESVDGFDGAGTVGTVGEDGS